MTNRYCNLFIRLVEIPVDYVKPGLRTKTPGLDKCDPLSSTTGMASKPRTTGAAYFDPDTFFNSWANEKLPKNNQFRASIISTFDLLNNDSYVYHAIASVTLAQVQEAINHGGEAGFHAWYLDDHGKPVITPTNGRDSNCLTV